MLYKCGCAFVALRPPSCVWRSPSVDDGVHVSAVGLQVLLELALTAMRTQPALLMVRFVHSLNCMCEGNSGEPSGHAHCLHSCAAHDCAEPRPR